MEETSSKELLSKVRELHTSTFVKIAWFILFSLLFFFLLKIFSGNMVIRSDARARLLLVPPSATNTEALHAYTKSVEKYSVESNTITVGKDCQMSPLIIKRKENSILTIDNKDIVSHTIAFEDQNFFNVSAGQIREINIMSIFKKGEGVYRYRCNDVSLKDNVGIMYIVK